MALEIIRIGIRRVGLAVMVLFLGLVAQLTYLQVAESKRLSNDPHNTRKFLAVRTDAFGDFDCTTGEEVAANGRKVREKLANFRV